MPSLSSKYDQWIPGVLSMHQIRELIADDFIANTSSAHGAFDYSSMDLHLTDEAYRLPNGSIKPSGTRYLYHLKQSSSYEKLSLENDGAFLLKRQQTHLFKLSERLGLGEFIRGIGGLYGQATAKSSVGRVDVLARLIVDGSRDYEVFAPDDFTVRDGNGDMYVEITPITFDVKLRPGGSVNQLRMFLGAPHEVELKGDVLYRRVLRTPAGNSDGSLSVNLDDTTICGESTAAFVATPPTSQAPREPICLWHDAERAKPNPRPFWSLLRADEHKRLTIEKDNFYILRSKEAIALPKGVAVYCRASDETIGEMRIHYAGFVHPLFGYNRTDGKVGTPLIFEVRGHNVNVSLVDGERMAKLTFYRMSEDAVSDTEIDMSYNDQELQLSKYFGDWSASQN